MVAQAPCGSVQLHTRLLVFQEDPKALARKAPEGWGRGLPLRLCKAQAVGPGMCFAMLRFFQQFERADWASCESRIHRDKRADDDKTGVHCLDRIVGL